MVADLKHTPLYDLHLEQGARMTPFAGYEMPLQYKLGVLKEHLHVREAAGLFDVSHMGQIILRPRGNDVEDVALALEALVPVDVSGLKVGRQRYGVFTNDQGGILDDLMIARREDHLLLVVNAACKSDDEALLVARLSDSCVVEPLHDRALLALQGPASEDALAKLAPDCRSMSFMDVRDLTIAGADCVVSRSGYTGEDGYEISVPADKAAMLAKGLLAYSKVELIGLGARDSLRLEAGLCLYGSDMDDTITPVEAALEWAIQKVRRKGGAREGGFPGAGIILDQLENGAAKRRVGIRPDGRAPIRGGAALYAEEGADAALGVITSGAFGPSLGAPVAMGYVPTAQAAPETRLFAELRGRREPAAVADLPFVPHAYKRS